MDTPDGELLDDYLNGSQAAIATLVRRHVDATFAAARRRTNDPATADDVTQQAFVLMAAKARTLRHRATVAGWLMVTARQVADTANRAAARRHKHEQAAARIAETTRDHAANAGLEVAGSDATGTEAAPSSDRFTRPDLGPLLDDVLARLPELDRDAVVLRHLQGRSYADVGRTLGLKEDAARKRVSRALDTLRGLLVRRGVAVNAAVLAAVMDTYAAPPAPAATVGGVLAAVPAAVSTSAAVGSKTLAKGAAMAVWKKTTIVVVSGLIATAGAGVTVRQLMAETNAPTTRPAGPALAATTPPAAVSASTRPAAGPAASPTTTFTGDMVYISGHVGRPGAYAVNGRTVTLRETLNNAGALGRRPITVRLLRADEAGGRAIMRTLAVDANSKDPALDEPMRPGDQVIVQGGGWTARGEVKVTGPFMLLSPDTISLREAFAKAELNDTKMPMRAYLLDELPPDAERTPRNYRVRWVADTDGPMAGTGTNARVRADSTLYVTLIDAADDEKRLRQSAIHLREIGRGMLTLYRERGELPADFVDLVSRGPVLPARFFLSPRLSPWVNTDPPEPLGRDEQQWLAYNNADYVYSPPPWSKDLTADWVLAHEPLDVGLGEVLVLTGDGDVHLLPAPQAMQRLRRQTPTTRPAVPNG